MKPTRALLFSGALLAAAALPPRAAAVQLSEVLYDAAGTDNGKVFVELWGAPGTSLDGWTLEGVNGADGAVGPTLTLSGAIPSDGFFVVSDTDGTATQVANSDLTLNFDFQNGPDSVVLRNQLGQVLDASATACSAPPMCSRARADPPAPATARASRASSPTATRTTTSPTSACSIRRPRQQSARRARAGPRRAARAGGVRALGDAVYVLLGGLNDRPPWCPGRLFRAGRDTSCSVRSVVTDRGCKEPREAWPCGRRLCRR
jgi:hypothetical protein